MLTGLRIVGQLLELFLACHVRLSGVRISVAWLLGLFLCCFVDVVYMVDWLLVD